MYTRACSRIFSQVMKQAARRTNKQAPEKDVLHQVRPSCFLSSSARAIGGQN
jgi:hypothetical protein